MVSLFFRNLFFTLLQPGIVAGLAPYWIIRSAGFPDPTGNTLRLVAGWLVGITGLAIMLDCIRRFATEGKGTLSPADPTKKLVIKGLYRYTRNPMYVGVMGILLGESLYWNLGALWWYTLAIGLAFHLFILYREEPL